VHVHGAGPDYFYEDALVGEVRLQLRPVDAGDVLFAGVGPSDQVAAYLSRVSHDEFTDIDLDPFTVDYTRHPGDRPATAPTAQTFWTASDSGPGARTLTWKPAAGDWTVVVMRADGSAGVRADIAVGGKLPIVRIIGITTVVLGIVTLLGGLAMVGLAVLIRGRRRPVAGSHAG
jgi:hypothetical protein